MRRNNSEDLGLIAESFFEQIRQLAEESGVDSMDDLNAIASTLSRSYNVRAQHDLGDLSPEQVQSLIGPDSIGTSVVLSETVTFSELASLPLFYNARRLLQTIHAAGSARATSTGAFNRALSTQMFHEFIVDSEHRRYLPENRTVINQGDIPVLELLRHLLPSAGLLRLAKRTFRVTKRGSQLLSEDAAGRLYAALFRAFFTRINLAVMDGLPEVMGLQYCIGYSIYQFANFDRFLSMEEAGKRLFLPAVRETISIISDRDRLNCFAYLRVVKHLAAFGLAEIQMPGRHDYPKSAARPTPLFHRFISFHLPLALS